LPFGARLDTKLTTSPSFAGMLATSHGAASSAFETA